jgi:hypothetical protein
MFISLLEGVNVLNDDKIQEPNPSIEITTANPIINGCFQGGEQACDLVLKG